MMIFDSNYDCDGLAGANARSRPRRPARLSAAHCLLLRLLMALTYFPT